MKLLLLVLGALLIAVPAHAVTFNDGGTHTIDADNSYPLDPVVVEDSPTGQPTTLIINEGGDIGSISGDGLTANGFSVVTLNAGSVRGDFDAAGSALVSLDGGSVEGDLRAGGEADLTVISGAVNGRIYVQDSATILIQGGENLYLFVDSPNTTVVIEGGSFREIGCGSNGNVVCPGGNCGSWPCSGSNALISLQNTNLLMTGGSVDGWSQGGTNQQISIYGKSTARIAGATMPCTHIDLSAPYGSLTPPRTELVAAEIMGARLNRGSFMTLDESSSAGGVDGDGHLEISGATISLDQCPHCDTSRFFGCRTAPEGSVVLSGNGSVHMTHGEIEGDLTLSDSAYGFIAGGTIGRSIILDDSALVEFVDGLLPGSSHFLSDQSRLKIFGGSISSGLFSVGDTARIELIGSDFNHPLGLVDRSTGSVTGTLSDGSPIVIDFQKAGGASVLLRGLADPTNSDLEVSFTEPPPVVDTYGTVSLLFSITNHGPDTAENVEVTLEAPVLALDSAVTSGTWSQVGTTFTSSIGTVESGTAASYELTYLTGADVGTLDHQVTIFSDVVDPISIDPDETNNVASAAITIQCGTSTIYAQNPVSASWWEFADSCSVPAGWGVSEVLPEGPVYSGYNEAHSAGYGSGYAVGAASADEELAAAQSAQATAEAEKDAALAAQATAESERDAALAAQTACSSDRTAALTAQAAAESARDAALAAQESAETARDAALAAQTVAESERDVALAAQAVAESGRDAALAAQEASESERDVALAAQAVAEAERDLANASQATAESQRDSALAAQATAESGRDAALLAQGTAESGRNAALAAQATAESQRDSALAAQATAESGRDAALLAQGTAESGRNAALAAQATAESQRDSALLAQSAAEAARDAALAAQATAEAARDSAVLAQTSAEADRNGALLALSAVTDQRDTALAAAASAEADRNAAAAALATALTEREAALAELLDTQLELDQCRTEITPEPNSAFLGFIVLAALGAVARGRRGKVGIS